MRTLCLPTLLCLTAALGAAPALADEVWDTNMGEIAWLETRGADAIFGLEPAEGGAVIYMVVPGLGADMMGGRGAYTGVWMSASGDVPCAAEMIDPMGNKSAYWGSFTLTFVGTEFPSDFAGVYGECLDLPWMPIQARARYAQ